MIKKALSLLFVIILLVLPVFSTGVSAKTIEELKKEKEKLTEQITQKNKELAAIKNEVDRKAALLREYEAQLEAIKQLIDITQQIIEEIKIHLTETQEQLDAKERELQGYYEVLGKRLRYLHMNNSTSLLSLVMGADSFSEALIIGQYMTKITENDTKLIDEVTNTRNAIESLRNSVNRDLADQETLMEENVRSKERATELVQEARSDLSYAQAEQYVIQDSINKARAEVEAAQAEINNLMAVYSDQPYVGGNFRWPVPGFTYISSGYGWRMLYGVQNFHSGIDIAGGGIYGAGVIASNSGTVSTVVYSSTGYGNYIVLDHGGGYMTLYGHLSSILVVKGEEVSQGSVIGGVGSTGNSTGPHLHFEIRLAGEKLNPLTEGGLLNY